MPVRGTPDFDALTILEIDGVDYRAGGVPALVAKAAFVNTKNGKTYGYTTTRNGWSQQTLQKLEELRASMEQDIAAVIFTGEGHASEQPAAVGNAPSGIGEDIAGAQI